MLTSSEVLTERKSFEAVVRSVLPGGVDPRVASVVLGLLLLSSMELALVVVEESGMVLTLEAKETVLDLD